MARIGLYLVVAALLYNVVEAGVGIFAGVSAGSIAIFGFGLDSLIETAAAGLLLYRLAVEVQGGDKEAVEYSERYVHRFVSVTLLLLAAYVVL